MVCWSLPIYHLSEEGVCLKTRYAFSFVLLEYNCFICYYYEVVSLIVDFRSVDLYFRERQMNPFLNISFFNMLVVNQRLFKIQFEPLAQNLYSERESKLKHLNCETFWETWFEVAEKLIKMFSICKDTQDLKIFSTIFLISVYIVYYVFIKFHQNRYRAWIFIKIAKRA